MKANTRCILQVEDDEHDAYFLKYAFEQTGISHPLRVVTSGEQAIEYLAGAGEFAKREVYPLPSLVLLDLKLPCKSGVEVLQWMREQPALRTVVVIVLTSWCDPADVERSYQLGANSFVVKPLELKERLEFARLLKVYWLGYNQFPPTDGAQPGARAASAGPGELPAVGESGKEPISPTVAEAA